MNKHTHGAWFLDQYGHVYGWDVPQPHMGTSTSVHVCTPVTNFADRALIAAAPELLLALSELISEWDEQHAEEDHRTGYTLETYGMVLARAAIAKATGGKPC